jgi:protein-S-isoprenylcysteine O-methyltransferase Ste14
MGDAWRVGIDRQHRTPLVSQGIFGWVRNPTYLGVHLLNAGVWLVWPTTLIGAYVVLTFVVLEIQVRCEEEHLDAMLGEPYRVYCSRTKRYLPWVY